MTQLTIHGRQTTLTAFTFSPFLPCGRSNVPCGVSISPCGNSGPRLKLLVVMGVFLVASMVFGVSWCARRGGGGVQDGFAVAGWVLGVATIGVGLVHMARESVVE
jgi:hypothetical protein